MDGTGTKGMFPPVLTAGGTGTRAGTGQPEPALPGEGTSPLEKPPRRSSSLAGKDLGVLLGGSWT